MSGPIMTPESFAVAAQAAWDASAVDPLAWLRFRRFLFEARYWEASALGDVARATAALAELRSHRDYLRDRLRTLLARKP